MIATYSLLPAAGAPRIVEVVPSSSSSGGKVRPTCQLPTSEEG